MDPRLLLLLVAIGFALFILRKALSSWISGPSREDAYRELELERRRRDGAAAGDDETGGAPPGCPVCGGPTERFSYPHLEVWRCCDYPRCRGFLKARPPRRPEFAVKWEKKRGRTR